MGKMCYVQNPPVMLEVNPPPNTCWDDTIYRIVSQYGLKIGEGSGSLIARSRGQSSNCGNLSTTGCETNPSRGPPLQPDGPMRSI